MSPPLSTKTMSASGNFSSMRSIASRLIDASSRIAVCGQPPVSTPMMRSAVERAGDGQQALVFLGVDVVGDDDQVVALAHRLAQHLDQRRLARADRPADADAQRRQGARAAGMWCSGLIVGAAERSVAIRIGTGASTGSSCCADEDREHRRERLHRRRSACASARVDRGRDLGARARPGCAAPRAWPSGTALSAACTMFSAQPEAKVASTVARASRRCRRRRARTRPARSAPAAAPRARRGARRRRRAGAARARASGPSARLCRRSSLGLARRREPGVQRRDARRGRRAARRRARAATTGRSLRPRPRSSWSSSQRAALASSRDERRRRPPPRALRSS